VERDEPTDSAIIVLSDDGKKVWLRRSLIEVEYIDRFRCAATVTMPKFLAIEKGLV
jgi:hypothetical protein